MSYYTLPYLAAPEGAGRPGVARLPVTMVGAIVGVGLLMLLPGQARAEHGGSSYGSAEITLGFPNGQVTVGKTWEDNPRQVVVEQVTHRFPETEYDDEDEEYDDDEDESDRIIIEKRVERPRVKKVTIIERYEEPVRCDREVRVVRKVYVERPSCDRSQVVVYRNAPQRVIYAPSRTVIVAPVGHGRGHHSKHGGGSRYQVIDRGHQGPRDLFPEDQGRSKRGRGVQQHLVQVGGHAR